MFQIFHPTSGTTKSIIATVLMLATCSFTHSVKASVKLPRILSDGMVIQRADSIRIWGWADVGESVQVKFCKAKAKTVANSNGEWKVTLPPQKAGGPYKLFVNDKTLNDVYVGDVWLISGQSNVDVHIERVHRIYEDEVYNGDTIPQVRLIQLDRSLVADGERDDIGKGSYAWECAIHNPKNLDHWSALSYFYAKEMWQHTGIPQGVINASLGGSDIVAWMSRKTLEEVSPRHIQQLEHLLQPGYLERNARLNQAISKMYNQLLEEDPGIAGRWMSSDADLSEWWNVDPFSTHIAEENGRQWRGTIWFRRTFNLTAEQAAQEGTLFMGYMIDADETYVNGVKVGSTSYEYPPRIYKVRKGLLRPGSNQMTIRLRTNGSPVKFKTDKPYKLVLTDGQEISLAGPYQMCPGILLPGQPGVEGLSNSVGTVLHNGQIAPLKNVHIAGIIWYQGETNAGRPDEYAKLLPALMNQWRGQFGQKTPVIICSLANYMERHAEPARSSWAQMRNIQRTTAQQLGNAALANLADLGEWNDIHPWRKKEAAHRCFLQARRLYLHEKNLLAEGPAIQQMTVQGNRAVLSFDAATGTLVARQPIVKQQAAFTPATALPIDPDGRLLGFTVAGADGKFFNAEARIVDGHVEVWNDQVSTPQTVRYGWDNDPLLSLYNEDALPAAPFEISVVK